MYTVLVRGWKSISFMERHVEDRINVCRDHHTMYTYNMYSEDALQTKMNSALRYLFDYIFKSFDSPAPSKFYPNLKRKKENLALEKTCCEVFVNFTTSWENSDLKGGWLFRVGSPQRPYRLNDQIIHPLCNAFGKIIE